MELFGCGADRAYTAGFLHNTGRLGLFLEDANAYAG
jgi:HD-like signal output (HDOD) protein